METSYGHNQLSINSNNCKDKHVLHENTVPPLIIIHVFVNKTCQGWCTGSLRCLMVTYPKTPAVTNTTHR